MSVLVTGGTGFIGQQLVNRLVNIGHHVLITSRNSQKAGELFQSDNVSAIEWNPSSNVLNLPGSEFKNSGGKRIEAVVNLHGEAVAGGRWTKAKKQRIRDSRVLGTRHLIDGLIKAEQVPDIFVSASAVGIYGDRADEILTEQSPIQPDKGNRFLIEVCQDWETEADRIKEFNVRVVKVRIGIVLGLAGGALQQMLPIFRLGGGGRLGSGKQWFPWIHQDDLVRLLLWLLQAENPRDFEVINATAPQPIQNKDMTRDIASILKRPAILPVPAFALRLSLGEFADELLSSKRVVPASALEKGFEFRYSEFATAFADLVK